MMNIPHVAQSRVLRRELDLPKRQAVAELEVAVRRLRALEGENLEGKSVVARSDHARKLRHATEVRAAARISLESLLEEV